MEGDIKRKQSCRICGGTDFFKDAGYFYCETCQTQNEDVREEVLEMRIDATTRLRKVMIKKPKVNRHGEELGWTTWELYNFVLIGLTDQLIELGASSCVKLTVLQLWATYLGKIEVAFTSTKKKHVPKLSRGYNKKDAEIIYGKVRTQKKIRGQSRSWNSTNTSVASGYHSDGSSSKIFHRSKKLMIKADYDRYLQSQPSSINDGLSIFSQSGYSSCSDGGRSSEGEEKIHFNKQAKQERKKIKELSKKVPTLERDKYEETHITTQYRTGPQVITAMKLWAIIYLALRIHDEPIHLGDMLRYAREGHMSYFRLDHLLPPEIKPSQKDVNFLSQNTEITHKGMRRIAANMAKYIGIEKIYCPNFLPLISRYCQELALPRGILLYAERLIALSPPTMTFDAKKSYVPNYEARAMAYIIVVLKVLFGLDGVTERVISNTVERVNAKKEEIYKTLANATYNKWEKKFNQQTGTNTPCIIVHGGIGPCKDIAAIEKITACKKAACNGYKKLINGDSSVEAVETALWWLECDEFFNCGYGSVLNEIGQVEMDASIMDGEKFECGSVAAVSDIEHPISLARYVLEKLPNTIIVGESTKQLAQCANINWLSEGNMIAPMAYLAYKLSETGSYVTDFNMEDIENARILQNSTGTVGCVAWNGCSIAAGTTTGGLNRKMAGRVGDSPLLGCGTYADKNVGCSLTGHGESMIKLGMARRIAEDINQGCNPRGALQKNFDHMLTKFAENGGGIVLKKDGSWDAYFTSKRMPYAVVKYDMVTFGIDLNEQKTEIYKDLDDKNFLAHKQGVFDQKLFNFCEWQRYIECRKNVLANMHFPTKLKCNPNVPLKSHMYSKFLEYIQLKRDGEEPEITDYKHLLPRDLADAMKQAIDNLNRNNVPPEEVQVFAPSLTPFHSYLQQILDDTANKLPDILKTDFYFTKVGYMTNIQTFKELAVQCNIDLEITDSSSHFIDKIVPYFEPSKIANLSEFQRDVLVCDNSEKKDKNVKTIDNFITYMDKKAPCYIRINDTKLLHFDNIQSSLRTTSRLKLNDQNDFVFRDVLPSGKLLILEESESESESESEDNILNHKNSSENRNSLTRADAYKKYNVTLTNFEEESIDKPHKLETIESFMKRRMHRFRDSKGKFMKAAQDEKLKHIYSSVKSKIANEFNIDELHNFTGLNFDISTEMDILQEACNIFPLQDQEQLLNDKEYNSDYSLPNLDDCFDLSDISILCEDNWINKLNIESEAFSLNNIDDFSEENSNSMRFYRPFKDYWMYHCIFSRVKGKNFELFEKVLPRSFRWLLNECANILEMTMEDLYEEVCIVESFHSQILNSDNLYENTQHHSTEFFSRLHRSLIISKW